MFSAILVASLSVGAEPLRFQVENRTTQFVVINRIPVAEPIAFAAGQCPGGVCGVPAGYGAAAVQAMQPRTVRAGGGWRPGNLVRRLMGR